MTKATAVGAMAAGLGATVALFAVVWMTGGTFGQRCEARGFKWNTVEFDACVSQLAQGK